MVDAHLFARNHENMRRGIRPFRLKAVQSEHPEDRGAPAEHHAYHTRVRPDDEQIGTNRKEVEKDENNLFCMSPLLDGFSFDDKKWREFAVPPI